VKLPDLLAKLLDALALDECMVVVG